MDRRADEKGAVARGHEVDELERLRVLVAFAAPVDALGKQIGTIAQETDLEGAFPGGSPIRVTRLSVEGDGLESREARGARGSVRAAPEAVDESDGKDRAKSHSDVSTPAAKTPFSLKRTRNIRAAFGAQGACRGNRAVHRTSLATRRRNVPGLADAPYAAS